MLCYVHDTIDQLPYDYYAIFTCQIVTSMLFNKHISSWKEPQKKRVSHLRKTEYCLPKYYVEELQSNPQDGK